MSRVATFDPGAVGVLATACVLYARAVHRLATRGVRVSRWQQSAWYGGITLMAIALLGPLGSLAEDLLSFHMAEHLIIADLAAPLLVVGLRWPVLAFFLPRQVLVPLARRRRLRRALAFVRLPLVALILYVLQLYFWHMGFAFEAAVNSNLVHGLQHQSFVVASLLVWWAALEPQRRRMPGELWKIGHIIGARLPGMFLGMAFIVIRVPVYSGAYGGEQRPHGFTAVADQQLAGAMMLSLDFFVTLFALCLFFWRSAADFDRSQSAAAIRTHQAVR